MLQDSKYQQGVLGGKDPAQPRARRTKLPAAAGERMAGHRRLGVPAEARQNGAHHARGGAAAEQQPAVALQEAHAHPIRNGRGCAFADGGGR